MHRQRLVLLLAICLLTLHAPAQIVNIESARMQSDTTGWLGGASLSATLADNGSRIFILNADAHVQYKTPKNLWLLLASSNLLKVADQRFLNNAFAHLRYNRKLNNWLRWEAFIQEQNNSVTQIDSRFLLGTGPRFKIASTPIIRFYAATLVMYENEREATTPTVTHNDIRGSNYISFTITPTPTVEIITTTFYQPLLRQWSDYRLMNQTGIAVKASKHFALSIKGAFLHDSHPAGTAPKTTYTLSSGFDFSF